MALLALMTVGCASVRPITESEVAGNQGKPMEWVDANGKHDTAKFDADSTACYAETRRYSDDNRGSDKYFEYRSCMRLKGWRFVPAGATK